MLALSHIDLYEMNQNMNPEAPTQLQQSPVYLSFITLILLISFASINAVLFTPALPNIAHFFGISSGKAELTVSLFLIGYALAQLLYGPLSNRWGRKKALYLGIAVQILSSLLCAFAGIIHEYGILVLGRLLLALGSGVGLTVTFTMLSEVYTPRVASQKVSHLMLAFAITPALSIALGGFLNKYYGWESCFYASALYGLILLFLVSRLPETLKDLQLDAFKIKKLIYGYGSQFTNRKFIGGSLILGGATSLVYLFAAVTPLVAINLLGMSSVSYGLANLFVPIGLIMGSLFTAQFVKRYSHTAGVRLGILIVAISAVWMLIAVLTNQSPLMKIFFPTIPIYFGMSLIFANASTLAMNHATDKSYGSAVMNFINMGVCTILVLGAGLFPVKQLFLPTAYIILSVVMGVLALFIREKRLSEI